MAKHDGGAPVMPRRRINGPDTRDVATVKQALQRQRAEPLLLDHRRALLHVVPWVALEVDGDGCVATFRFLDALGPRTLEDMLEREDFFARDVG